jgi:hypothetical protein
MRFRYLTFIGGLAVVLSLGQEPVAAQAQPLNAKAEATNQAWTTARTADGQPDLQGVWANNNATPLQRPKELAGRATLTDEELAALRKAAAKIFGAGEGDAEFGDSYFETVWASLQKPEAGPHKRPVNGFDGKTGDYSSVWLVSRVWDNRTSLITDPPDGRIPLLTQEAKKRQGAARAKAALNLPPAGPEDLSLGARCVTFGSPRLGAGYNSYYQIFQTRDSVAIEMELGHEVRVIPIDGRPHLPPTVGTWLGDSRGHWEGDTLVVDTTNYKRGASMGASANLHTIERFTRTGPDTLKYEVTFNDPATWTKPWSVMIPLQHSKDAMYEYACHEGNYALTDILRGARAEEKAAAEEAAKTRSK